MMMAPPVTELSGPVIAGWRVEGRELAELAFAEQAEPDEEHDVDQDGANQEMGPGNAKPKDLAEASHASRILRADQGARSAAIRSSVRMTPMISATTSPQV